MMPTSEFMESFLDIYRRCIIRDTQDFPPVLLFHVFCAGTRLAPHHLIDARLQVALAWLERLHRQQIVKLGVVVSHFAVYVGPPLHRFGIPAIEFESTVAVRNRIDVAFEAREDCCSIAEELSSPKTTLRLKLESVGVCIQRFSILPSLEQSIPQRLGLF